MTDAWGSVKQWFTDALAGIADALPSWDDITTSIISSLPGWMVPDSYKTPQMKADAIERKIAQTQADIEENSWWSVGRSNEDEKAELAELLAEQTRILAKMTAEKTKQDRGGYPGATTSASTTQNNAGNTIIMQPAADVSSGRPDHR